MEDKTTTMIAIFITAVIMLVIFCCVICFYIKLSDSKLRVHITEMAQKKGITVDMNGLNIQWPESQSPSYKENCTIMVPDVGIII